jgi:hypothetical protein
MSSPTSGSDPNYPQGNAPQGQPGWNAPQAPPQGYGSAPQGYGDAPQGYGAPAPTYSGAPAGDNGQRPGTVTAAAIIGIVWGGLGALLSFIVMLGAFALGAALGGLVFLLSLAFSVALLVGGIFVLQGKPPKLLLYASYAAIALGVLGLIVSAVTVGGNAFSGILGIIIAGAIVALLFQPQSKQYFAARGQGY